MAIQIYRSTSACKITWSYTLSVLGQKIRKIKLCPYIKQLLVPQKSFGKQSFSETFLTVPNQSRYQLLCSSTYAFLSPSAIKVLLKTFRWTPCDQLSIPPGVLSCSITTVWAGYSVPHEKPPHCTNAAVCSLIVVLFIISDILSIADT